MTMFSDWLTPSGKERFRHHSLWGKSAPMQDKIVWLPHSGKWVESKKQSSSWIIFQVKRYGEESIGD
ncbi:hypothetical protein COLU111180_02800 [Cohnella lubricantis]